MDGRMDGRTDGRMDGRTDRPSYRDAFLMDASKNGCQIRVQHKKICQNSEVPELFGNFGPTLKFLP